MQGSQIATDMSKTILDHFLCIPEDGQKLSLDSPRVTRSQRTGRESSGVCCGWFLPRNTLVNCDNWSLSKFGKTSLL